ncbi:MAG: PQQ-like beta-propeller repeat protein [Dehalococcoidia bacterium]|nr:PQQ-like beta-propeller repeat protein [Dehalococcoidia bacterium]
MALPVIVLLTVACAGPAPTGWSTAQPVSGVVFLNLAAGRVVAADATNGERRWQFPSGDNDSIGFLYAPPTVVGNRVFVAGGDGSSVPPRLYSLNAETGAEEWRRDLPAPVKGAPLVLGGAVYVGTSAGQLLMLDAATGQERGGPQSRFTANRDNGLWSTPVARDGVIFVSSMDRYLYALDAADIRVKRWEFRSGGAIPDSPTLGQTLVYVAALDNRLYAVDIQTGREVWRFEEATAWLWGSPLYTPERLFVGSFNRKVYALNPTTGQKLWEQTIGGRVRASPVLAEGVLLVGGDDNRLYALDPATGERRWDQQFDGPVISTMTTANGILYVSDNSSHRVTAIDIRTRERRWEFPRR